MDPLPTLRQRLDRYWPTASLRTYLVAMIVLATLPIAALMSWQILMDVRARQSQIESDLARAAAAYARTIEGELASPVHAPAWNPRAARASTPEGGYVALYDAQGRLVGSTPATPTVPPRTQDLPRGAADGSPGAHRVLGGDGRAQYATSQPVGTAGWSVRAAVAAAPIDSQHRRAILGALAVSGGSLLVGVLLALAVARRIAGPLHQLARGRQRTGPSASGRSKGCALPWPMPPRATRQRAKACLQAAAR